MSDSRTTPNADRAAVSSSLSASSWLAPALAGALGSLIFLGIAESFHRTMPFLPSAEAAGQPYSFAALNVQQARASALNSGVVYALMGAGLALFMALTGLVFKSSFSRIALGAAVGVTTGILLPFALCWILYPFHFVMERSPSDEDLVKVIGIHGAIWGSAGLAAGLAFALASSAPRQRIAVALGGLIGAVVGTVVYEFLGMLFLPEIKTTFNIPDSLTARVMAWLCVGVGAGIGIAMANRPSHAKSAPPIKAADPQPNLIPESESASSE